MPVADMSTTHDTELATAVEDNVDSDSRRVRPERTPLPKLQLFIVLLVQFAEPLIGTVIYPFINQFVTETGITGGDERKTGHYAGLMESVFFLGEAATVLSWGRASDYLGRKPVLLLGPLGLTFATLFFGLSRTYWMLFVWRLLQGMFNGNIGVSKTVMAEITDSTNVVEAYSLIPVMLGTGYTLGPLIGGILANPADRWPALFGTAFFRRYPYFLPCAAAASVALLSFLIGLIAQKETLPSASWKKWLKLGKRVDGPQQRLLKDGEEHNYGSITRTDPETNNESTSGRRDGEAPPSIREILTPRMKLAMMSYGFLAFNEMALQALQPLVYFTSPTYGGLGFDPYTIGIILGVWGLVNGAAQALFAGRIIRKFGPKNTVIGCFITYVLGFAAFPLLRSFAHSAGGADWRAWIILVAQFALAPGRWIGNTAVQIIIIETAPGPNALGTSNGLGQATASAMRGLAPSIASSIFSVSLEKQLLGGNLVFLILVLISGFAMRLAAAL